MAVYTDVSSEELTAFLADYDIGELLAYKGIAEGVENSNFLVHTGRGNFILTLYEKRVAAADLPFFLGLMEHLAGKGLTCPLPVRARDGEALGQREVEAIPGHPCTLDEQLDLDRSTSGERPGRSPGGVHLELTRFGHVPCGGAQVAEQLSPFVEVELGLDHRPMHLVGQREVVTERRDESGESHLVQRAAADQGREQPLRYRFAGGQVLQRLAG